MRPRPAQPKARGPPPAPAPPLTPTGRVILGMIAMGKQSGYEIKQLVDKSTRHFWAASYGQIYPELKRLEADGLIQGRPEPSGARARTVYELTERGHAALDVWLTSGTEPLYEVRDESMLKLFFSDSLPEQRIENIRVMRAVQERKLAQLLAIEEHASQMPTGPCMTLQLGLAITRRILQWCDEAEAQLA